MRTLTVNLGARSYPIYLGRELLAQAGEFIQRAGCGEKVGIVTHPKLAELYLPILEESLKRTGFRVVSVIIPEGEEHKNFASLSLIYDRLIEERFDRGSCVVALGGGVVGDLAGFAAATFLRGVPYVQVPTTLLAQVDASIGGKTAIDHPRAKNLIGAFHQPRFVVVDPAVLLTLPEREFRSGLAEVIKHGIVLDAAYFADLEAHLSALLARDLPTLTRVVAGSCRIKAAVVERDEQEAELRAVLNYGHTIGHAVEAVTGFERWTHGEAVALGIAAEARLAERLGIAGADATARQTGILQAVGLPVRGSGAEPAAVIEALARDKKARDGRVPFVLAPRIGAFRLVFDVPQAAVLETLEELA